MCCVFFFNDTATTEIYTLSLHDALPISGRAPLPMKKLLLLAVLVFACAGALGVPAAQAATCGDRLIDDWYDGRINGTYPIRDRKSTRLNSSHANISYAVFCLKKKKVACD